jgi:alcohol dehydrogenase
MLNAEDIIRKMITIKGLHNYNDADLLAAVDFIEKFHSHFPFHALIEASFTLQQVEEAFQYVTEHNPYRVGISFN